MLALAGVAAAVGGASVAAGDRSPFPRSIQAVYQGSTAQRDRSPTAERLGCTPLGEPANFVHYSLGADFEGLQPTTLIRRCDAPYPGEPIRANYISYIYGDCTPGPGDEAGCAPPAEIQTSPACEVTGADLDGAPASAATRMRGVPGMILDGGTHAELYAGRSTIVIFGSAPLVEAAIPAVRAEPDDRPPSAPLTDSQHGDLGLPPIGADLPRPSQAALDGTLRCDA
jgi:hypothetical protein